METPKTDGSKIRQRHVPTPKMSERKKSLFGKQTLVAVDNNMDLGLIQPLECSDESLDEPSAENNKYHRIAAQVMKENRGSIDGQQHRRKLTIPLKDIHNHNDPNFNYGKPKLTPKKANYFLEEDAHWGFQDENSDDATPPKELVVTLQNIKDDLSECSIDSNSLLRRLKEQQLNAIQSVTETNDMVVEDEPPIQTMKTPGDEWHRTQQKNSIPKASSAFLKAMRFDSSEWESESEEDTNKRKRETTLLTDPSDGQSPPSKKMLLSKARTSLSFNELPEIPSNLFYRNSPEEEAAPSKPKMKPQLKPDKLPKQRPAHRVNTATHSYPKPKKQGRRIVPGTINNGIQHRRIKKRPQARVQTREEILRSLDLSKFKKLQISDISKINQPDEKKVYEKQISRLREIWKNSKNTVGTIKPVSLKLSSLDNSYENLDCSAGALGDHESEDECEPEKVKKFFKTGSNLNKNRFKLINNIFGTVDHGKVQFKPIRKKKRKLFTPMFEEDGDDNASMVDASEIGDILKTLDTAANVEETPLEIAIEVQLPVVQAEPEATLINIPDERTLFPIFYKDQQQSDAPQLVSPPSLFDNFRQRSRQMRPIMTGANQYQIDAGQKAYGGRECPECGLFYTQHVPEEELLHEKYHKSMHVLTFKGWQDEAVVCEALEWGVTGRIVVAHEQIGAQKWSRVKQILQMVDQDLGIFDQPVPERSMVYLAVAHSKIIGVCVAHPLQEAFRLLTDLGQDFCSMETYSVKCGISRIWVPPPFRGQGIAKKLVMALRAHFVFGYHLPVDEIAFSSPTEEGKMFAESVTKRKDFYVYY